MQIQPAIRTIFGLIIAGMAPHKILLTANLPIIYQAVIIDGATQPAYGYTGAMPHIELDGNWCHCY